MADKNAKVANNVPGKYYVDSKCIFCGQCHNIAPEFFVENPEADYMYVAKQPANADETGLCEEALAICPVNAIGSDGAEK